MWSDISRWKERHSLACSAFWCPPRAGRPDYGDPAGMAQLYLVLMAEGNAMQGKKEKKPIKNNRLPWDAVLGVWFHPYGWSPHTFRDSSSNSRIFEPKGAALPLLTGQFSIRPTSLRGNLELQGLAMFICATLRGILISNCAGFNPLNGHTGAVVQPSFCVPTLSKKSCLRTSAGG